MALHGWMSPDGMEELLAADVDSRNKELKDLPSLLLRIHPALVRLKRIQKIFDILRM